MTRRGGWSGGGGGGGDCSVLHPAAIKAEHPEPPPDAAAFPPDAVGVGSDPLLSEVSKGDPPAFPLLLSDASPLAVVMKSSMEGRMRGRAAEPLLLPPSLLPPSADANGKQSHVRRPGARIPPARAEAHGAPVAEAHGAPAAEAHGAPAAEPAAVAVRVALGGDGRHTAGSLRLSGNLEEESGSAGEPTVPARRGAGGRARIASLSAQSPQSPLGCPFPPTESLLAVVAQAAAAAAAAAEAEEGGDRDDAPSTCFGTRNMSMCNVNRRTTARVVARVGEEEMIVDEAEVYSAAELDRYSPPVVDSEGAQLVASASEQWILR